MIEFWIFDFHWFGILIVGLACVFFNLRAWKEPDILSFCFRPIKRDLAILLFVAVITSDLQHEFWKFINEIACEIAFYQIVFIVSLLWQVMLNRKSTNR